MSFFTENPWPLTILLVTTALIAAGIWNARRQTRFLSVAAGSLMAAIALIAFEHWYETPAEEIERHVTELTTAFREKRRDDTLAYFSQSPATLAIRTLVELAIKTVTVDDDLRITQVQVEMMADNSRAKSHFRANGTVRFLSASRHYPSRWLITWQREADEWKIIRVQMLDVITGEPQVIPAPPGG